MPTKDIPDGYHSVTPYLVMRDAAKAIDKERAATAECANAQARNRGLKQFVVRGLEKVKAIALWYALAHNLLRAVTLRIAVATRG